MKLLIATVVMLLAVAAALAALQGYRVVGRVCPSCGASGGEPDDTGDTTATPVPGDVTWFAFLAPERVNRCWCSKCGNKWRIVRG